MLLAASTAHADFSHPLGRRRKIDQRHRSTAMSPICLAELAFSMFHLVIGKGIDQTAVVHLVAHGRLDTANQQPQPQP